MMTVYFSSAVNVEVATYENAVHNINCIKLLKDGYFIFKLDGRDRRFSVKTVRCENYVERAAEPLLMNYAFWIDGEPILSSQQLNLSTISNIFTEIV